MLLLQQQRLDNLCNFLEPADWDGLAELAAEGPGSEEGAGLPRNRHLAERLRGLLAERKPHTRPKACRLLAQLLFPRDDPHPRFPRERYFSMGSWFARWRPHKGRLDVGNVLRGGGMSGRASILPPETEDEGAELQQVNCDIKEVRGLRCLPAMLLFWDAIVGGGRGGGGYGERGGGEGEWSMEAKADHRGGRKLLDYYLVGLGFELRNREDADSLRRHPGRIPNPGHHKPIRFVSSNLPTAASVGGARAQVREHDSLEEAASAAADSADSAERAEKRGRP